MIVATIPQRVTVVPAEVGGKLTPVRVMFIPGDVDCGLKRVTEKFGFTFNVVDPETP